MLCVLLVRHLFRYLFVTFQKVKQLFCAKNDREHTVEGTADQHTAPARPVPWMRHDPSPLHLRGSVHFFSRNEILEQLFKTCTEKAMLFLCGLLCWTKK